MTTPPSPHIPPLPAPATPIGPDPWWKSAVIYQIYPRSFADANHDGIGDLGGIIEHLDHLAYLGVDAIWLCPIYTSPQDDNGYDISDYYDIDPLFGSLDDFDELVRQAHRRHIRVIMDLVANHTSDEHPWFTESASAATSGKRDWYWWRNPRAGHHPGTPGAEPTNWRSFFSGPAWSLDPRTDQYYLHLFSRKQPDLNWENPEVRHAIHDVMRWWLDRGVDGFRMDVANMLSKNTMLPDAPTSADDGLGDAAPFCIDGPRIDEFFAEIRQEVFTARPGSFLLVAEAPGVSPAAARNYTDPRRHEVDMVFQFDHVSLDQGPGGKFDIRQVDLRRLRDVLTGWQQALADIGWNSLYWGNHDQPRAVSRFGDATRYWRESATTLATLLHLQRGTPYIFQGDEIGMTNTTFDRIEDFRDIESLRYYHDAIDLQGTSPQQALSNLRTMSRDNARTPMQWDSSPHAAFTTTTPWIPLNPNHDRINVAAQRGQAGSILEHYRALIKLRHEEPAVVNGDFTTRLADHPTVFAYQRHLNNTDLAVFANISAETVSVPLPDHTWRESELLVPNYPDRTHFADPLTLRPWESLALRRTAT